MHMFNFETKHDQLTIAQVERWKTVRLLCRKAWDLDAADPLVFHGTTAMRATSILRDGFRMTDANTGTPTHEGVHWGSPHWAEWAAARFEADDPPAILMARLSDVLASGTPCPDLRVPECGDVPDSEWVRDWRSSLAEYGSMVVLGGRHVANLTVLGLDGLPLHPYAKVTRERRLKDMADGAWRTGGDAIPCGHEFGPDTAFARDDEVDLSRCYMYRFDRAREWVFDHDDLQPWEPPARGADAVPAP